MMWPTVSSLKGSHQMQRQGLTITLDLEFLSDRVGGITNLQIFNRFGTIVYDQVQLCKSSGTAKIKTGNELPTGTYYYVIDLASRR